MLYYPVNLNITGKNCLVIGGGKVAERKVEALLCCGALVKVVSPALCPGLEEMLRDGKIMYESRPYERKDLDGVFLVVASTNDTSVNDAISREAHNRNILCNIVDKPDLCNFTVPSIVRKGDLMITISTGGKSPALSKRLRREIEESYGDEYAIFLEIMGALRRKILGYGRPQAENEILFNRIVHSELLEFVRQGDSVGIDELLSSMLGPEFTLRDLGIENVRTQMNADSRRS